MPRKSTQEKEIKKEKKLSFYQGVGRKKEATAKVRLYLVPDTQIKISDHAVKKGDILVNFQPVERYFSAEVEKKLYLEPFRTTNTLGRFAVLAKIGGGGRSGQLGAFVHGVSRALIKVDKEKYHSLLKKKGFLTRDSRVKERRKAGFAQKSRAKKQSPKR